MNRGPYVEIRLTPPMIELAHTLAKELGVLRNSIEEGAGNITGFCAELACKKHFGIPLDEIQNTYHYDILVNGITYDVKAKKRKDAPRYWHEASISDYNTSQKCNFYLHTSVTWPERISAPTSVYLMGFYPKQQYLDEARFLKKGQIDGSNNFEVKGDCWNLVYEKLNPISQIKRS